MTAYKILIVEDSKLVSRILEKKFTHYGYKCHISKSFQEAEKILHSEVFDFIILDLNLPDMYGEELVQLTMKLSDAKIFVLTVEKDLELREALYKNGILDYLIKDKYFDTAVVSMHKTMQSIDDNHDITILSVDDSRFMRDQISKILHTRNYNVITAKDAKETFKFLAKNSINVIVLDMELPDRHGIEVLRELKARPEYEHIPVIILSGSSNQEMVRECLKIGSFDFIRKPFNIEEFVLKVDMAVLLNKKDLALKHAKDNVEHELHETSFLAKEYQDAINKSNILSHTDTKHRITGINEKFCEISGFKEDEILGQTHLALSNDIALFQGQYNQIITTVESGKVWVGKITRKNRQGELFYTETTVMPIYDTNRKIIEYLWMSSDITKIMQFHYEIEDTQKEMIYKMGEIAESRSQETGNHIKRVAECCKKLAILAGLSEDEAYILYYASPMHDIGKVAISDDILKKPSKLNSDEWEIMKTHSEVGYCLFKDSKRPILQAASIVAYMHHEKWDGSGYPQGLKGEDIHIYGRIVAIADVFDALSSERVYKKAWDLEDVKKYFIDNAGTHFDPHLANLFLDNFDAFVQIRDMYKDII
ncbi:response regulator [Sulfurimonas sp. NWX79]|uniref:response regulator n=1 Tax=Sulfurimonas sp. NWX79 TaxID=2925412 RepID=UPI003204E735